MMLCDSIDDSSDSKNQKKNFTNKLFSIKKNIHKKKFHNFFGIKWNKKLSSPKKLFSPTTFFTKKKKISQKNFVHQKNVVHQKNSTQIVTKLKNLIVTKIKHSNCGKTQILKLWQNSKYQILTKLK